MMGMEMMMKSLGLDPEEIKKTIGDFGQVVIELKSQMDRIETKLNAVIVENQKKELDNAELCEHAAADGTGQRNSSDGGTAGTADAADCGTGKRAHASDGGSADFAA